jgi:hypothetical protein
MKTLIIYNANDIKTLEFDGDIITKIELKRKYGKKTRKPYKCEFSEEIKVKCSLDNLTL